MKVKLAFLVGLFIAFGLSGIGFTDGVPTFGNYTESYTLYAGQTIDVGTVWVGNDADYLYVMYELSSGAIADGWAITETHVHVGMTLGDFPLNKSGNPKIGRFDYSMEHNPYVFEYEYEIPNTWDIDDNLLIAAHAVVNNVLMSEDYSDVYGAVSYDGIYRVDIENESAERISLHIDGKNYLDINLNYIDVDNGSGYINGIAFDAVNNMIYLTAPPSASRGPSSMWSFALDNNPDKILTKLGILPGVVVGASFYEGYYYYMEDYKTELRRIDVSNIVLDGAENITSSELVYDLYGLNSYNFTYGDFAISKEGMLYGSTRVKTQMFFSVDLSNGDYLEYSGATALDLQLAFGSNTILYGQKHGTKDWYTVNVITGEQILLADSMGGKAFWDLSSGIQYDQVSETAWGEGTRFVQRGNWAMYFEYTVTGYVVVDSNGDNWEHETAWGGATAGDGPAWWFYYDASGPLEQTIWAGQHHNAGTVKVENGTVYITFTGGWELQDVGEAVKIKGYDVIPDRRPAAGQFTGVGTYKGDALTYYIGYYNYYAIHIDARKAIP